MNYLDLITIKEHYNQTPQHVIKGNLKRLMKLNNVKHSKIIELLDISTHTAYSYTNTANNNKPELYNLLILSSYFDINIYDLLKE